MTAETGAEIRRDGLQQVESDLLTLLLKPCRLHSRGVQQLRLEHGSEIKTDPGQPGFVLVLDGACRLETKGERAEHVLQRHDGALFTRASASRLLPRSPLTQPAPGSRPRAVEPAPARDTEPAAHLLFGFFAWGDDYTAQTLALLPEVVTLRSATLEPSGWFEPFVESLLAESTRSLPGGELLRDHMLHVLLIHALRQSVELPHATGGLVAALRVPGLGTTMGAMHARPEHDWSVEELAEMAGLSRAAYAARFLETVGLPPFQYLRNLRMHNACRLLRETEKGIKEIAARVGYATEASFSKAFARWWGDAPGEYRRQKRVPVAG